MENRQLGLLRLTDHQHQTDIKQNLSLALEDLYDWLGGVRESARALEDEINIILYGSEADERRTYRTLRQQLLDHRG